MVFFHAHHSDHREHGTRLVAGGWCMPTAGRVMCTLTSSVTDRNYPGHTHQQCDWQKLSWALSRTVWHTQKQCDYHEHSQEHSETVWLTETILSTLWNYPGYTQKQCDWQKLYSRTVWLSSVECDCSLEWTQVVGSCWWNGHMMLKCLSAYLRTYIHTCLGEAAFTCVFWVMFLWGKGSHLECCPRETGFTCAFEHCFCIYWALFLYLGGKLSFEYCPILLFFYCGFEYCPMISIS